MLIKKGQSRYGPALNLFFIHAWLYANRLLFKSSLVLIRIDRNFLESLDPVYFLFFFFDFFFFFSLGGGRVEGSSYEASPEYAAVLLCPFPLPVRYI